MSADPSTAVPEVVRANRQLAPNEPFTFSCHPGLDCFNTCCADVSIVLTPFDVLTLARALGLTTRELLARHTVTPVTKDLKLPMVLLEMGSEPARRCPFVGEKGCTVYEARPWACRMYPLGMAIPPARAGEQPEPLYFLFEDDFCHGRAAGPTWTVERWREDQGAAERDRLDAGFRDLVTHPWFIGGRTLDERRRKMLFTACYDLDTFRSFVFESSFRERFELEPELVERLRTDDLALLDFAYRWLRFALFAEPTLRVREPASPPRRMT